MPTSARRSWPRRANPVRRAAQALGAGALVFGILPAIWPSRFGRWCGIARADDRTVATAIRSVGVRDAVIGLGLVRAVQRRDASWSDWLLARTACDTGDTLAVALAVSHGARDRRFLSLGGLALGAAVCGWALVLRARE